MVFKKQSGERSVTVSLSDDLIAQLQRARARDSRSSPEELVHEAVTVYAQRSQAAPAALEAAQIAKLSRRQRQVLEMIARGRTTKEIAQHLGISIKTADWHRGQLMKTLKLRGVVEVVRYAIRTGIIQA